MILAKESSHNISDYFGKELMFNKDKIENYDYLLDKYNSIDSDEIKRVANKYFTIDHLNLLVMGNYEKEAIEEYMNENYPNLN